MKKTWSKVVAVAVLLCMMAGLGAYSLAAGDSPTILAVNGDVLSDEQIAALKSTYTNSCVLDVSGTASSSALDVKYSESYPVEGAVPVPDQPEELFLGKPMTLGAGSTKITLIGVNYETDAAALGELAAAAEGKAVAVGKPDAEEAVKNAGVTLFLTTDASDGVQAAVTTSDGSTQVVNVGKDPAYPVVKVTSDGYGNLAVEPLAPPQLAESATAPEGAVLGLPVTEPAEQQQVTVYAIYFDGSGADNPDAMPVGQAEAGSVYTLPESAFTREGFTFNGWDVGGSICAPGSQITVEGDVYVTAQWVENYVPQTYVLHFDGNTPDSGAVEDIAFEEGTSVTLPENSFTRAGYTFDSWLIEGIAYYPGDSVLLTGETTAYANWIEEVVYTVSFDGSGAETGYIDPISVKAGEALLLPQNSYIHEGYDFQGWSINDVTYQPGETAGINSDVTAIAQWVETAAAVAPSTDPIPSPDQETGAEETTSSEPQETNGPQYDGDPATPLEWTIGSTDGLAIRFTNILSVIIKYGTDEQHMTGIEQGTGYELETDQNDVNIKTYTLKASFLNNLVPGTYIIQFEFPKGGLGQEVPPVTLTLEVKEGEPTAAPESTEPSKQDVQVEGSEQLTWKIGSQNGVSVKFNVTANVAKITYNNTEISNADFQVMYDGTGTTVTLPTSFLSTLPAGTYGLTFTFQDTNDKSFNPKTLTLTVEAPDVTNSPTNRVFQWVDRNGPLYIRLEKAPSKLQVKYDTWKDVSPNYYQISGNTITVLPALINSTGFEWHKAGYNFRIVYADNSVEDISIQLLEDIDKITNSNAPVPTASTTGPSAPATGDTTPIALYVVILVLLVAALAVVIILLTRKNRKRK